MSVLERVDWGEVCGDLLAASPRAVRAAAAHCVARSTFFGIGAMTFAVLVTQLPRRVLWRALEDHGDVDPITAGWWLTDTAHIVLASVQPDIEARVFPAGVGAHVDDELAGLPLLGAAVEHAASTGRRLGVYRVDLGPAIAGRCEPRARVLVDDRPADAVVIELRDVEPAVWRHELAHALDPDRDPRTHEERERYADSLARRLAALPSDAPLSAVQPLAEQTYTEVWQAYARRPTPVKQTKQRATRNAEGGTAGEDWPAPGVASLMAFAALPLIDDESR